MGRRRGTKGAVAEGRGRQTQREKSRGTGQTNNEERDVKRDKGRRTEERVTKRDKGRRRGTEGQRGTVAEGWGRRT